jgi:glyoxalase family protein
MTTQRQTQGFHHITMVSTDAQRTLDFYSGILGLDLVKQTVNFDDPSAYHLYFGVGGGAPGTSLTFFEWPNARPGGWGIGGVHHLALSVKGPEGQIKWKRRLTDAGIPVSGPYDRGYFWSIYFRDPDGQILEIATEGPGYDIDEPANALGRKLITPDQDRLPAGRDEATIQARTHPEPVEVVTPDMRLSGIHHISGITADLEDADGFYREVLGLPLVKKTLNQDDGETKHYFWASYDGKTVAPHSSMTLFGWPGSTYQARPGAGQTHHIAFRARDEGELAVWQDRLRSRGIQVTPVQDRKYFKSIYFPAPDGLLVELATDGPGFAIDEDPDQLGTTLRLPEWLEGRREEIETTLTPLVPATGAPATGAPATGAPATGTEGGEDA